MEMENYEEIQLINFNKVYGFTQKFNRFMLKPIVSNIVFLLLFSLLAFKMKAFENNAFSNGDYIPILAFYAIGYLAYISLNKVINHTYFTLVLISFFFISSTWEWILDSELRNELIIRQFLFFLALYLYTSTRKKFALVPVIISTVVFSYLSYINPFYAIIPLGIAVSEIFSIKEVFTKFNSKNLIFFAPVIVALTNLITDSNFIEFHTTDVVIFFPFEQRLELLFGHWMFAYVLPLIVLLSLHFGRRTWKDNFIFMITFLGVFTYFYFFNHQGVFLEGSMILYMMFLFIMVLYIDRNQLFFQDRWFVHHIHIAFTCALISKLFFTEIG
jgi:hypothetical protein